MNSSLNSRPLFQAALLQSLVLGHYEGSVEVKELKRQGDFGIGTFAQVNAIVDITRLSIGLDPMYTAIILTLLVAAVTIGGLQSIASVASKIVPAMALVYFIATVGFLLMFIDKVPAAFMEVLHDAFTPTAAAGGFAGSAPDLLQVIWQLGTDAALSENARELIAQSIAQDPRPAYQNIPERVYVMSVAGYEVKFQIQEKAATIIAVEPQAV